MSKFKLVLLLVFFSVTLSLIVYLFRVRNISNKHVDVTPTASIKINEPIDKKVTLLATGDVMLGRTIMTMSMDNSDWVYPMRLVGERMIQSDITFINLENPIVEDCPIHNSGFTFCSLPESIESLKYAGVDLVTLANNHSRNYGEEGLHQTVEHLDKEGIKSTSLGEIHVIEKNGTTFGFLGFDLVTNEFNEGIISQVTEAESLVDILVIGVHWGAEYQPVGGDLQRQWARQFVISGADLVIGHHPHWVQDAECINISDSTPISVATRDTLMSTNDDFSVCPNNSVRVYYSLGNFVFDQMWSEETRKGLAVEFTFEDGKILKEELLPVYMNNWAQPEWVD